MSQLHEVSRPPIIHHGVDVVEEVQRVAELLSEVGNAVLLPLFRKGVASPQIKEAYAQFREIVTEADILASKKILSAVRDRLPGSYSEEEISDKRFSYPLIWQFDPLDGTEEFCRGMQDGFAIHGALLSRDTDGVYRPVGGILVIPGRNEIWQFDVSNGARYLVNGLAKELPPLQRSEVAGYMRAVDPNPEAENLYKRIGDSLSLTSRLIECGGAGAAFGALLRGEINLLLFNYDYSKEWDTAMAEPIVRSRGGFICDFDGNDLTYNRMDAFNRRGFIASIVFQKAGILPYCAPNTLLRRL